MNEKEFAGELFDALARRRGIVTGTITKALLRDFWEQLSDQSFDARIQTFFDMYIYYFSLITCPIFHYVYNTLFKLSLLQY